METSKKFTYHCMNEIRVSSLLAKVSLMFVYTYNLQWEATNMEKPDKNVFTTVALKVDCYRKHVPSKFETQAIKRNYSVHVYSSSVFILVQE